jgi:hypothetical protein
MSQELAHAMIGPSTVYQSPLTRNSLVLIMHNNEIRLGRGIVL